MSSYTIYAYRSQDTVSDGSDFDDTADTLKEAKRKAKHFISDEFRASAEMSERFGYAAVHKDGECVYDCFEPKKVVLTPGSELAEMNEMDAKHPGWTE